MVKRADLEPEIRAEWKKRPRDARTESDVLLFHAYLERERPDLLKFQARGDKYQVLKSILGNQIER